jgi:hypothetical protein
MRFSLDRFYCIRIMVRIIITYFAWEITLDFSNKYSVILAEIKNIVLSRNYDAS